MYRHYYESVNGGEPACIDEQIPFDIPDSWEWVRAGSIFEIWSARRVHQSDWKKEGIPFYRAREIGRLSDYGIVNNELFISHQLFNELSTSGLPKKGDLMITAVGTLGKVYIVRENDRFYFKDASVISFRNYGSINPEYLRYLIASAGFKEQITNESAGTTVGTITIVKAKEYLMPIPPLSEQCRIATKIKVLEKLVAEYHKHEQSITSLNTCFPEALKKSILQHAIQGKLVPQDPTDEPASVLLERIAKERAKKGKKAAKSMSRIERRDKGTFLISHDGTEKDITADLPFDIPYSWEWCLLDELGETNIGLTYKPADIKEKGVNVLRANNIQDGKICYDSLIRVNCEVPQRALIHKGDLLICARNGSKKLVGKTALVERDGDAFGAFMAKFSSPINDYLYYFLNSQFFREQLDESNTTTIYQVTQSMLRNTICPLPPLAEQSRICQRLETLLQTLSK